MSKLKVPKQTEPTTQMFWIDSKTNLRHVFTCAKSKVATHAGLMKNNPYVKSFGEVQQRCSDKGEIIARESK